MANLHVVAGIPGTGIQNSLTKLEEFVRSNDISPDHAGYVSVERHLRQIAEEPIREHFLAPSDSILAVFLLPLPALRSLWREAFDECIQEIREYLTEDRDVILTLHLSYYHHQYREYVLPLDFSMLVDRLSETPLESVITLIDDAYDCHNRLCGPGQMFDPPADPDTPYLEALQILDWRSKELMLADGLAEACDIPHYVFATKHPLPAFSDLLYSTKDVVYLSHPISEIRRMRARGETDRADGFIDILRRMVDRLRNHFVVIEPTSIDEFRFRGMLAANDETTGNLTQRWPFHTDTRELLYEPPPTPESAWAFPVGWEDDTRELINNSPATQSLREAIKKQIGARDHWLVEQAYGLICYRPLFEGHISSGVQEELRHIRLLRDLGTEVHPERVYVLSPQEDRERVGERHLWENALEDWWEKGWISGNRDGLDRLVADMRASEVPEAPDIVDGEVGALRRLLRRYELRVVPVDETGALGRSGALRREERIQSLMERVQEIERNVYLDDMHEEGDIQIFESEDGVIRQLTQT